MSRTEDASVEYSTRTSSSASVNVEGSSTLGANCIVLTQTSSFTSQSTRESSSSSSGSGINGGGGAFFSLIRSMVRFPADGRGLIRENDSGGSSVTKGFFPKDFLSKRNQIRSDLRVVGMEIVCSFQSITGEMAASQGYPRRMSSRSESCVTLNFPIMYCLSILITSVQ